MDRPLLSCLSLLLLLVTSDALSASRPPSNTLQPLELLQMTQGPPAPDENILFYISDEDKRNQVAVEFNDAVDYAQASVVVTPGDHDDGQLITPRNPFMTGDVFDNDLSDETKLRIGVAQAPVTRLRLYDEDETTIIPEEPPDTDEDPFAVSAPVDDMMGDMDDDRWNAVSNLRIVSENRKMDSFDWGDYVTIDDQDDWTVSEIDRSVYVDDTNGLPIPAQRVPTREFVYDVDEEALTIAGVRYVKDDLSGNPVFYSRDPSRLMTGDMYDNERSDERPLLVRVQEATNPLVWARIVRPPLPAPIIEEITSGIDEDELIDIPVIEEIQDFDEIQEIDTVFEPVDIEVRDEDHGGDLNELVAFNQSDYMVGDLFDNSRTDEAKLTIVGQNAENRLQWAVQAEVDVDEELNRVQLSSQENIENTIEAMEIEVDVDEVENLYTTPEEIYTDIDEFILPEPFITETIAYDTETDELSYSSPLDYMSGDLYDNGRSDASMLNVNRIAGDGVEWSQIITDRRKVVYDLQADKYVDADDQLVQTFDVVYRENIDESSLVDEDDAADTAEEQIVEATNVAGDRLTFYDSDDIPTFYSSDPKDYLAGDLFDNDRSDSSRLNILEQTGTPASWRDIDDITDTRNPGFLPCRSS